MASIPELVIGLATGWLGHVFKAKWDDRRAIKQFHYNLRNAVTAFVVDLEQVWNDLRAGRRVEERRIGNLEVGLAGVARVLEGVMLVPDREWAGRLTLWYQRARTVPDDIRLFVEDKRLEQGAMSPGERPQDFMQAVARRMISGQRRLLEARERIEGMIRDSLEFQHQIDVGESGPGRPLQRRLSPPGRP